MIYLVTCGSYSDYHVNAAFATEEEAREFAAYSAGDDDFESREWWVEEIPVGWPEEYSQKRFVWEASGHPMRESPVLTRRCLKNESEVPSDTAWGLDRRFGAITVYRDDRERAVRAWAQHRRVAATLFAKDVEEHRNSSFPEPTEAEVEELRAILSTF